MRTLLINDRGASGARVRVLLEEKCGDEVIEAATLQAAIESMEVAKLQPDLIVCDYRGGSRTLLKCFLAVSSDCPCVILVSEDDDLSELLLISRNAILETVTRSEMPAALDQILARFSESFGGTAGKDANFLRIDTSSIELKDPLWADVYIRLGPDRYCRRFKKEDGFDASDLEENFRKKGITELYLRKEQGAILYENQVERLDALTRGGVSDEVEARRASSAALEIVRDAVTRIGFTPEVRELAQKTVNLTLKSIGNSPDLSPILTRLRKNRGKYITSHSLMLAEIGCAVAHRIGWGAPPAFLKLCFAAFVHDLPLSDNVLAQFQTLEELRAAAVSPEATHVFKLHPIKAAEYASQFPGIPSDVDLILLQHHELPDGSGFPRGMLHHQIHPMACIFILSHDLLRFFLEQVPSNSRADMLGIFLASNKAKYADGFFAKIRQSLESGIPLVHPADQSR